MRALAILRDRSDGAADPDAESLTDAVMVDLDRLGHQVRHDGQLVADPDTARRLVRDRVERAMGLYSDTLPRLGLAFRDG